MVKEKKIIQIFYDIIIFIIIIFIIIIIYIY